MAYCKERIIFDEDKFSEAVNIACCLLQVNYFYDYQMESLPNFFKCNDLFFSAHTGYGKSLIFQAIPIITDVLQDQVISTSTVLVVSPLLSLKQNQIKHVNETFGISAAGIFNGQEEEIMRDIEDGVYSLLYTTPEGLLGNKRWRTLASSQTFRQQCVAFVVDVAHSLVQW
jgi:superfamily II DNA helicase RecQ